MAARIAGLLRTRSVPSRSSSSTLLSGTSAKSKANHLAVIKAALGDLDRVERIVKIWGYVNVAPGFTDVPSVINGRSDLLVNLWGERGRHARVALGVASLSRDAPVETEVIVQVRGQVGAGRGSAPPISAA
jgi:enamine deaminase RidA (YjgF/YER057c/UK114 family)